MEIRAGDAKILKGSQFPKEGHVKRSNADGDRVEKAAGGESFRKSKSSNGVEWHGRRSSGDGNRVEKAAAAEISMKSKCLDVRRVYTSGPRNEGHGMGRSSGGNSIEKAAAAFLSSQSRFLNEGRDKGRIGVGDAEVRNKTKRKSSEELSLRSFELETKKSRSSLNEANVDRVSSASRKSDGSLLAVSQNFNWSGIPGNIIQIPKKSRGSRGQKCHFSNPLRSSNSVDKLNFDCMEGKTARLSSPQNAKKEGDQMVVDNGTGGDKSSRKRQRNHRIRKSSASDSIIVAENVGPAVDNTGGILDDSQDDEENLEQNAARMLSSRFDPRCTGPSSKRESSSIPSGSDIAENLQSRSEFPSADTSNTLRPRNGYKEKRSTRKRRHFYEVVYREEDAHWLLNRKIKVFGPLDENWYYGLVTDYDEEKKLHRVKYDNRDWKWMSLQNERIKLLLFANEVTGKKRRTESMIDDELTETNTKEIGCHLDSEPMSSWLARSSHQLKSSPRMKKKKISHSSSPMVPPLSDRNCDAVTNKLSIPALAEKLVDGGKSEQFVTGFPIVYSRRRSCKKKEESGCVSEGKNVISSFQTSKEDDISFESVDHDKQLWSTDTAGMLKLNMVLIQFKEFNPQLKLPLRPLLEYTFGADTFRILRLPFLLKYGTIVAMWPTVQLEVLFVDNAVGLRFFLFEGCLKQAVAFVFLVLSVFQEPKNMGNYADLEMPVTSVRFKLSSKQDISKQHVFGFYSFSKLKYLDWLYLDSRFEQHCLLAKKLPLSECTFDNIKALEGGSKVHRNSVGWEPSFQGTGKKSVLGIHAKHGMIEPFALSFTAAPSFFLSLHLKLLMDCGISCISCRELVPVPSPEHLGNTCKSIAIDHASVTPEGTFRNSLGDGACNGLVSCAKPQQSNFKDYASPVMSGDPSLTAMSVKIPSIDLAESSVGVQKRASDFANVKSLWAHKITNLGPSPLVDISPVWPSGRPNIIHSGFGHGPRKPRTQVQYALPPFGGLESRSNHKGRIRRASVKRLSDSSRGPQRNLELLACAANVLSSLGDRCWRECGARVVLELADNNEWQLAVKFSGSTKYSHKVQHVFQPGSTNRHTHAMMWKGGKDWTLEFPDRGQWALFKEMHEECYNRNMRAASVKNIPIPGVRLIQESEDSAVELPFTHRSPRYFRQIEADVDMAMNPSKVLYDMDSDDEQWVSKNGEPFGAKGSTREVITDEVFEKIMDIFEKVSYAQQCDHFTDDEIAKFMVGIAPMEVTKAIYQHWQQKRRRTGMPLIRQLQPPLWETYQRQMKEWEQSTTKSNAVPPRGAQAKAPPTEKPAMFAFCLKPRGLKVLNKGSKHRSHRRFPSAGPTHTILGDQDGVHTSGRRLNSFSFGDDKVIIPGKSPAEFSDTSPTLPVPGYFSLGSCDASEWNNQPKKLYKNNSKKIGTILPLRSNLHVAPSYGPRMSGTKNVVQQWNIGLPEWPSQKHRHETKQSSGPYLDELKVREASCTAKNVHKMARVKREKARRLFARADVAIYIAAATLMTANTVKSSYEDSNDGSQFG